MMPKLLVPSRTILTTSMALAAVLRVGVPPAKITPVNVPVRDPVASCLMIRLTVCPVLRLVNENVVF